MGRSHQLTVRGGPRENIPLSLDEQLYLCEHLWSTHDTDPQAAEAYHHLQATYPQAVLKEYAWLYCRAAQQHRLEGPHALALFGHAFSDREPARAFFAGKDWDFNEVEFRYLELAAALEPGHFPAALGADYPAAGEALLLARSQQEEKAGHLDIARATAEVLHKLSPAYPQAFDRLAYLHDRTGNADQAVVLLEAWFTQHPEDPLPLVRFALLLHRRGLLSDCQGKLRDALELCTGKRRARIAFLGATLTLQACLPPPAPQANGSPGADTAELATAEEFLHECLRTTAPRGGALVPGGGALAARRHDRSGPASRGDELA